MAYDEDLAGRVREALSGVRDVGEIKMFGGLCFTVAGHMAVGVTGEELMVRVGSDAHADALSRPYAREMTFTGKSMNGFVFVSPGGLRGAALASWVDSAVAFVKALPPKTPKKKRVL